MDALISLPVIGYFMMPGFFASYSTSLNLLFFYMTWSTLVLSQPPLKVEVIGTLGIRVLFWLMPATLFLIFDSILPSLAVGIKHQSEASLPTRGRSKTKISTKSTSRPQWFSVIALSLVNITLSAALQAGVELLFTQVFHIRSALKITTTLPMPFSILKDLARSLLLREVLQYYIHRFILHPSKPNVFSKQHQKYFHSITAPYSFAAHYDHPLPYILWRFIPVYLPSVIFRPHLLTYFLLLALTTLEETFSLSGYTTVPGIMLGGIARRQDLHSAGKGRGNFAPWGLLDWMHGTSIGTDVVEDMQDEAEKHRIQERGSEALEHAKDSGRRGLRGLNGKRKGRKA
ncbi:hypothetical protein BP6252_01110 [Coleophoma cylindrospora]|uniref:Fatty acid hydroxylase domain-containing protein n=1 Tax=Coleophoma cylindrospora TaxID=1849047 RepID=A0A3D8STI2_9HELO|nr:hypothetical protein BP6252_01110 [Coleophoma cylindrospora]